MKKYTVPKKIQYSDLAGPESKKDNITKLDSAPHSFYGESEINADMMEI